MASGRKTRRNGPEKSARANRKNAAPTPDASSSAADARSTTRDALAWQEVNGQIVACDRCPRLCAWRQQVATEKRRAFASWDYWGRPVENFGDPAATLLIVGLAPAAHGANRTGRMFTGDRSGDWLYRALFKSGFANQPTSAMRDDGLELRGAAITAVCHCAPPDNKPSPEEVTHCRPWLEETFSILPVRVVLALGKIAWDAAAVECQRRGWLAGKRPRFGHAAEMPLASDRWLLGSYHPSQQNTFTGKLTERMFDAVFARARDLLER